jgi:hypothetical protein
MVISMVEEKSSHRREREMDKELSEIRAQMEKLAFKMQQESKVHWRYEWPLKRTTRWHVQKLLARRQQQMLKRWLRHAENLGHKGKRSGKDLAGCQVGNESGSVDLIKFQVGRRDIPDCQVGKGEEMSSAEISFIDEEEEGERPHSDGDSCKTVSHVNEDDEKFQTSITEKEDQRIVLIIGGVEIFLPSGRGEASTDVADATGRQPTETVMEEKEHILMSVPTGERLVELFTQWELELKALEDWLGNLEPEGGCREIAMRGRYTNTSCSWWELELNQLKNQER